jgi:ABC-type branched-subunit amino acid transport system substrate-binding protein
VDSFLAMNKKKTVLTIFFVFLILFLISLLIKIPQNKKNEDYVKVGILQSLTGKFAYFEIPIYNTILLTINNFNKTNSLLEKKIQIIAKDTRSIPDEYEKQLKYLIEEEKVEVIFGGGDLESLERAKPILEKNNKILFFSGKPSGFFEGSQVYSTASTITQSLSIFVKKFVDEGVKKFYFVGSNNYYSKLSALVLENILFALNAELVGKKFISESFDKETLKKELIETNPGIIVNSISGSLNNDFF